ncbi:acyl-CoA dehydrogenase family protein [Actinomadura kijaniata]|uniref:Acyl-CoA dehydrogenase n=1 Tax=Actinomadura namibiensis TaxID=182080 RepID=A0A7W3LZT3_ACTNM|nr:acyl-CoA dehydrogenase family protein [Actinomadura namibiensis]MBA8957351.1 acyl-CoA dehydrogenase [Actinomadura namibiensis]
MDFTFDEDQESLRELAREILGGSTEDDRRWRDLARSGLLGITLPEELGGSGGSFVEFCLVVEAVGASGARAPLIDGILLGAAPVAVFGTTEQRSRLIPPICEGTALIPGALDEGRVRVTNDGGWSLTGTRPFVPLADTAERVLVAADDAEGRTGLFLVDPFDDRVELQRQDTFTGRPEFLMRFDSAPVPPEDVLRVPGEGAEVLDWLLPRVTTALCVHQLGCSQAALDLTAAHLRTREQFGRPLGAFQAASQRIADAYIDVEGQRLTAWQAAWRLAEGMDAAEAVAIAAWWACDAGSRVLHSAQHLHGGLSTDLDYPLHRFVLEGKRNELVLGGASAALLELGDILAGSAS